MHVIMMIYNILYKGVFLLGVLQAHGVNISQVKNYNSIHTIKEFSIAEYYYEDGRKTIDAFSHSHEEYEFIIPIDTIPLLIYEKANYIGEVGYIYPVNPNVVHGIVFPLDKSQVIDITIDKEYLDQLKAKLGFQDKYFYTRFNVPPTILEVIRDFQAELSKPEYNVFKAESLAKLITSALIVTGLELDIDNRRPEKKYRKNIKNMIQYMYENFKDPELDIAYLAKMSDYSVAYFTKAFKAYMNDTPILHLNKLRISEAKALLLRGETSFSDIYKKVGYRNLSSFTEAFKRITGVTPTEYKKKYKK